MVLSIFTYRYICATITILEYFLGPQNDVGCSLVYAGFIVLWSQKNGYTDQGEVKSYRETVFYSKQRLAAPERAGVPEAGMPIS